MLPHQTKTKMATKIFAFETSRGVYTYIGGTDEAEARQNFPTLRDARCVGEVPAGEFYLSTTTSPSVLYQREAKSIRRGRKTCKPWYAALGVTLR